VIKNVLVPTLDDSEVLLLTREHVLSGSYFDAKRTDTLKKSNPRKYLFVKLLNSIRQSSTFKSSVDAIMMGIAAKIDDDVANSGKSSSDKTPTDDDPGSRELLEEETTEPKKKDKGNGDRQAKALKELQINGSFGFNNSGPTTTTTTTTSCPYNFRGIQQQASGGVLSNSAATQKSQKLQPADSKKTPKKPPAAPKPQKKLSAKKTSQKVPTLPKTVVKTPSTQRSKSKPSPVIDLEETDEEEEKPLRGRVSRSSKTVTIPPSSLDVQNTKLLEEINRATEVARREMEDMRRERAKFEHERKDQLKREQQNNLKKRTSKTKNCY